MKAFAKLSLQDESTCYLWASEDTISKITNRLFQQKMAYLSSRSSTPVIKASTSQSDYQEVIVFVGSICKAELL